MEIRYWDVITPDSEVIFVQASNAAGARKVAREILGVGKLPKGTKIVRAITEIV